MSHPDIPFDACLEPIEEGSVRAYCFDEMTEQERVRFEIHLLACPKCWRRVHRLQMSVDVLTTDRELTETVMTPDVFGVLGKSGALELTLAGHLTFALIAALLWGLLFAVPVVVEIAYQFDRFGRLALVLAPPVFGYSVFAALTVFWVDVKRVRTAHGGFTWPFLVLVASTLILCGMLLPMLPSNPIVAARFQTYPVRLGYLKSVFYAWMAGPLLIFWPFHFVVTTQAQLAAGRHLPVIALLNREKTAVPTRGTPFVPVWVLAWYVAGLFVFNYLGVTHLFDNLRPGPYMALFMASVMIRVCVWLLLALVGIVWYANTLTELKRECLAVLSWKPSSLQRLPTSR